MSTDHRTPLRTTLALVAAGALLPAGIALGEHAAAPASSAALATAAGTGSLSDGASQPGTAPARPGSQDQAPTGTEPQPQGPGRHGRGQASSATTTSGTPVASAKGVVLVDTVLPGGDGAGTGITLTADGTILTNYHVVAGSTKITVTDTTSRKTYTATVLGHDATHDIAVLRLQGATGLSTATLNPTTANVGTAVTAIGQGGGQGTLYSAPGTITALDQHITAGDDGTGSGEALTGLLETSADVVPGYSGGPLVDASGAVVGIDTAASSGGDITGYAVPITQARAIADEIVAGTRSDTVHIGARGGLGISVATAAQVQGAGVVAVSSGSAAAKAGMTAGSVITGLDGTSIDSASALTDALDGAYPGTRVTVTWADAQGAEHTKTVALGTSAAN